MKSKFTWIFTLFMAFFIQFSFAQEKTVSGTVVSSADGMPIPEVNVTIQGTNTGVRTDFDGNYAITVSVGQKLVFSFVGMKTQIVTVGTSNVISVSLEDDVTVLEDVEIGYTRTATRATSNVAVSTVTSKTIEGRPNASFVQTLQGQIPGLNISTGSGQPGSSNTLVILRGIGSINGNVEPLYVIDGMPMSSANFRSLNPNDIDAISVLKDAGATSIYGNRGANGVIIVKTKRGSFDSDLSVRYIATTGFSQMQSHDYRLMSTPELLRLERSKGNGMGAEYFNPLTGTNEGRPMTDAEIDAYGVDTNWLDVFFRTGFNQSHTLSLNSGSKNLASFTTIGYNEQEGILKNTGLKRFNFRNNLTGKSQNDKLNYSTAFTANYSVNELATSFGTGQVNNNYLVGALQGLPYYSPDQYVDGSTLVGQFNSDSGRLRLSPLMLLDRLNNFVGRTEEFKMLAQGQISYKITPELTIGNSVAMDYTNANTLSFDHPYSWNSIYFGSDSTGQEYNGFQSESFQRIFTFNNTANITFNKTFSDKHTLDVSAYTEYFKAHLKSFSYLQNGLDPKFTAPGAGTGFIGYMPDNDFYVPEVGAGKATSGLFSYFATADYDYDAKYGVGASIRRDASFRFADSNKWGTFYSVSARWNIDRESFMEGVGFDMLKLRASYGTAGNQDITGGGVFSAASLTRAQYAVGSGYANAPSLVIAGLPNRRLQWETVEQANIGVDFSTNQGRLRGTIDVFQKKTKDLYQSLPISSINATTGINANFGSLKNTGIELLLTYDVLRGSDYVVTVSANGSYTKNKLVELPSDNGLVWNGSSLTANREGDLIGQYYLVKYIGVNPATGNLLFEDRNGNPTEAPVDADRKFTGKSAIPKYQGGFSIDAQYKGFFLTTQFTYVADLYRYDYDMAGFIDVNDIGEWQKSTDLLRSWTPDNRVTDMPSINNNNQFYENISDRHLKDASYLRMRYVSLGYNFSKDLLRDTSFSNLRVFAQAENLLTWSKWRGFDAESNRPNDQAQYPTPKIFTVGLELEF